jgi:tRNA nucleotidyltransferase (CCA-adding enzyme)
MEKRSDYNMNMKISEGDLKKKILSDKYNTIVFEAGEGDDIYLVGGYLRDVLIGRKSLDRDYVVTENFEDILTKVASKTGGRPVRIGEKGLFRFVLGEGDTLDFSRLNANIEADLSQRDFTINSLAWSPERGIIDLCDGAGDISRETVRMIRAENITRDPVRIIRAYRLAGELSFKIDRETKKALIMRRSLMKEAKTERITLEFFKMLNPENPSRILRMFWKDGMLGLIIGSSHDALSQKVKVLSRISEMFKRLPLRYRLRLDEVVSQNLSYRGLLRLEILLKELPDNRLSLSSKMMKYLANLRSADELIGPRKIISNDLLFDIFERAGDTAPDFLITRAFPNFLLEIERYIALKKRRLLTAEEIKGILGIPDGVILGRIMRNLRKAEFLGAIKDKTDAVAFVQREFLADPPETAHKETL